MVNFPKSAPPSENVEVEPEQQTCKTCGRLLTKDEINTTEGEGFCDDCWDDDYVCDDDCDDDDDYVDDNDISLDADGTAED